MLLNRRVWGLFTILGLGLTSCSQLPSPPTGWRPGAFATSGKASAIETDYGFRTADGLTLAAKLTRPNEAGARPPVLVFIGGSGTWDSNYSQALDATRSAFVLPVPDLARRSAQAGYAFVRYQKRGVTDPGGLATSEWRTVRLENLMADLRSLLAKIQADPTLDGTRIALIGHSEGTMIATWVGATEPAVRAYVFMGMVRQNLKEVFRLQLVYRNGERFFAFADVSPKDARLDADEMASATQKGLTFDGWRKFDADRDGKLSKPEYLAYLGDRYTEWVRRIGTLKPDELVPGDGNPAGWFQQHFAHATVESSWRTIRAPVLVVQGRADTNTPFKTEVEPFRDMLEAQRHPDYRVVGMDGLDHWFKDRTGVSQAGRAFGEILPWLRQRL